jgi:phosphohistidine phosphatase SixA
MVFRHAHASRDGFLSLEGFAEMDKLAGHLKRHGLVDEDTQVICSREMRALKSVHHLMDKAGIKTDEKCFKELFSIDDKCDVAGAIRVIQEHAHKTKPKSLIVITHLEMVEQLPHAYGLKVLGTDFFPSYKLNNGEGFVIDINRKTAELFTQRP